MPFFHRILVFFILKHIVSLESEVESKENQLENAEKMLAELQAGVGPSLHRRESARDRLSALSRHSSGGISNRDPGDGITPYLGIF